MDPNLQELARFINAYEGHNKKRSWAYARAIQRMAVPEPKRNEGETLGPEQIKAATFDKSVLQMMQITLQKIGHGR